MPKPVAAWQGIKSAQSWGPICPQPAQPTVGRDDFVRPHRYWVQNEHCQVLNIWTPYSLAGKQTMIFDTVSAVRSHDDDKLLSLLPPPLG